MTKYIKRKPRKLSLVEVVDTYHNNLDNCIQFFLNIIFPSGFVCSRCGCTHYYVIRRKRGKPILQCAHCKKQYSLLANTAFEQSKLSLFQIILGLYLFFSSNKGISGDDLCNQMKVNYKTAIDFMAKCRIMMGQSNGDQVLESKFYQSDVAYIGHKNQGKAGMGTEQQPFLVILSTKKSNSIPLYVKIGLIDKDNKENINRIFQKKVNIEQGGVLTTDGKTTFSDLKDKFEWRHEKVNYEEEYHSLYWLDKIVSLVKGNIKGVYHGVSKRSMPLFMNEQEWRYNHRRIGGRVLEKVQKYMQKSTFYSKKMIVKTLDKQFNEQQERTHALKMSNENSGELVCF